MKNWLKKCSVALLVLSMIGTTMPVYAADAPAAKTQTTTEDQTEEQKSEVQAEEPQVEEPQQQEQTSEEQQSVDENVEGEQDVQEQKAPEQETTEQEAQPEESSMNYAYVESPYLQTPETQRIVVSWGTEDEYIEQMVLHVRKDDDTWEDWCISRSEGNLYLFEKYYEDEYQSGTYEVVSISVTENGETTDYALADFKMEAKFGVNQEYDGIDELQPVDEEQEEAAAEDAVGISVSTLNEDGTIEEQNSIEDALDAARTDVLASTPAMMSLDDDSGISTQAARSGKIVVALDPGHDDRDAGASYYGLKEEVLTLKIANYCKEELEKYAGVEVYMTRTSSKCPYPNATPAGGCITARANAAAKAGAKIFVSFHLNAASSAAKGAEVIIPNYNWQSDVGAQGRELATKILNELSSIGLYNRGLYYKTGTDPEYKYPDGSLEDWFTVQVANKYNGIPGIIVEHAFLTNSGDVNNFLNNEAGLKKLGVADATGIAKYLGLAKTGERVNVAEGTYVFSSALNANKVLSIQNDGFADQTAAVLNDKKDTSGQRFEVRSAGNGYYTITAEHSGKVLDVSGGSTASGATVKQYTSNGTNAQLWYFTSAGNGYYTIHSVLGTCLDVWSANTANGTMIDCYAYNGTKAQKWKLTKTESKPLENGTYSITNPSTNKALSVDGSSTADGANVYVTGNQNLSSQRFELTYVSNGYYKILAEHSEKSLDIPAGNSAVGVNLQQYSWNGSNAQLWKFVKLSDGSYYLRSKLGTVIGVQTSSTNVNMQLANQSNAQKWKIAKAEYKPFDNGEYTIRSVSNTSLTLTENNGNIQLGSYAGNSKQKFKLTYVSDGYYKIIESATGKALDICNGSSSNGANLQTYSWNGTNAQLWKFINMGNGSYYIRSKLGTVIDVTNGSIQTGTNIQMYTLNYSNAQKWTLKSTAVKAESIEEGTYTIQAAANTNYVLDIAGGSTSDGGNVQIYSKNNTLAQNFVVTSVGNGYYKIACEGTGKVLDVSGGSSANGTNIQQYKWNGSAAQCWRFIDAGNGSYYIQSKLGTVLDIVSGAIYAGNNVQTYMLNETNAQKWKLSKLNYADIAEGTYTIQTALSTNKVLDISGGSVDNSANVQIYDKNGTTAQNFVLKKLADHEYQITCENSGKALDVAGGSASAGTNVWQYNKNNSNAQRWRFIDVGNGYYYIVSKLGTVLDVSGASTANGANVQTYTLNKSNAQKWKLSEVKYATPEEGTYTISTALSTNKVLDIASGSTNDGANVQLYEKNGTTAQKFVIKKVSDYEYQITCQKSGKALDVAGASANAGTNVWQYSKNNSEAQKWRFVDAGNGYYYIISNLGTALDVNAAGIANGTNVQAYTWNKSSAQKWKLVDASNDDNSTGLYSIMGNSSVTSTQMSNYFTAKGGKYPYSGNSVAPTIKDFCQIYVDECKIEGVKAEVAFAQAMMETGFLRFGGDVKKEQYNFAGLGATGGGNPGNSFSSIRIGIRAQIQHLKAYASKENLKQECVDERYKYVTKGVAPYVEWLGQKENPTGAGWATVVNYGYNIVNFYITPLLNTSK
ncbi:RICIN domain-containing protein [Coprococcus comes]|uniref:RICIN domain-containing protein n=1 Tax=Coprococcus comes TaxID=410072 RepID=UPI0018993EF8|nr:RICIN domain-containing protein [Coprococcus comes]